MPLQSGLHRLVTSEVVLGTHDCTSWIKVALNVVRLVLRGLCLVYHEI